MGNWESIDVCWCGESCVLVLVCIVGLVVGLLG